MTRSQTSSISESRCELRSTDTPRRAQLLEQQAHGAAADGVERGRRLVEQQQPRLADERLRDAEALLHALRHAVDAALRGVRERDELEQPRALRGAAARVGEPLVQLEHLVGRVPAGEAEELGEVAERRACVARACARACDLRRAAGRAHEADGDLHERRLAGAVRAEQPDELALADLEVDAFQRVDGAVALRETPDGERTRHAGVHSTLRPCLAATWKGRVRGGRAPRGGARARRRPRGAAARVSRRLRLHRDDPEPHFLGWLNEVDPDELFASGKAWGVTVRRVTVA